MFLNIVAVAIGGAAGSLVRYLISSFVSESIAARFPFGTFVVNMIGCLLIGLAAGYFLKRPEIPIYYRLFVITGLLGGLTTFSTFGFETFNLLLDSPWMGIVNILLSVCAGLILISFGIKISA